MESSPVLARFFELLELLSWRRLRERELPRSLCAAAFRGDPDMVEVFLAKEADLDEETVGARSPLAGAVHSGRSDIVVRLLAVGARPDSKGAASRAAERNRVDLLELLFDAGLDPAGREARHALESAAIAGKATAMRFLISRGVILNGYDARFASMVAEKNGHAEIAAFLDEKRKDLAGVPDAEDRPIDLHRRTGRVEEDWSEERLEAEALSILKSGAIDREVDRTNSRGLSVLGAAIEADSRAMAEAALDHGAPPAGKESERAPIVSACSYGLASVVERIAPHVPAAQRDEALVAATSFGLPGIVELLLNAGANPSSAEGMAALAKAGGPYRDEIRTLIRRALRARGTRPGPALGAEGSKPRKRVAALGGVRELVKPLVDTNPDWTILALRMPIEEVSPRLAAFFGATRAELDVAMRGVEHVTIGVFVFQLAGHTWTLELHSLGFHHRGRWELDSRIAQAIAKDVGCETVFCGGSDTSGTFSVSRFDRGECIEQVEWTFDQVKDADAYFAGLQLFLPGCRIDSLGLSPRLDLIRIDPTAAKRLDWLVLEE